MAPSFDLHAFDSCARIRSHGTYSDSWVLSAAIGGFEGSAVLQDSLQTFRFAFPSGSCSSCANKSLWPTPVVTRCTLSPRSYPVFSGLSCNRIPLNPETLNLSFIRAALAERILEATGVSDPNLFLVKMLTRDQTHSTLEHQKARAHDLFERLNQSLQNLILHKRELQLEGVDEAYQKRSTGDIESRMIKSEARLARAIRVYHQVGVSSSYSFLPSGTSSTMKVTDGRALGLLKAWLYEARWYSNKTRRPRRRQHGYTGARFRGFVQQASNVPIDPPEFWF